jgi:hypothetical protein
LAQLRSEAEHTVDIDLKDNTNRIFCRSHKIRRKKLYLCNTVVVRFRILSLQLIKVRFGAGAGVVSEFLLRAGAGAALKIM